MANIFLSYTRKSESNAKALSRDIETLGHTVWFDNELSGGQVWWDQILVKIRDCDIFVFVLDKKSLASSACKREFGYAADLGKPILPILVSGDVSTKLLPPVLSKIQHVDYKTQDSTTALRLARAMSDIPPPAPLPNPLPSPPEVPVSYLGTLSAQVDNTETLSFEAQSALVLELKNCLREPENHEDTLTLFKSFRKRRDLLATIAEELDAILKSQLKTSKKSSGVADVKLSSSNQSTKQDAFGISSTSTPQQKKDQNRSSQRPYSQSYREPTSKERVKGGIILALIGLICGIIWGYYIDVMNIADAFAYSFIQGGFMFLPVSGAIAGAISGTNRKVIITAAVGLIVVVVFWFIVSPFSQFNYLITLLGSPAAAITGVYLEKRKISGE